MISGDLRHASKANHERRESEGTILARFDMNNSEEIG